MNFQKSRLARSFIWLATIAMVAHVALVITVFPHLSPRPALDVLGTSAVFVLFGGSWAIGEWCLLWATLKIFCALRAPAGTNGTGMKLIQAIVGLLLLSALCALAYVVFKVSVIMGIAIELVDGTSALLIMALPMISGPLLGTAIFEIFINSRTAT